MRSLVSFPVLAVPLLSSLVFAATSASAQTPPSRGPAPTTATPTGEVVLGDGNVLHGTITEIAQDDHVTVRLVTGQTALVKWPYLDRALDRGFIVATGPAGTNGVRVERALAVTSGPTALQAAASADPAGSAGTSAAVRLPAMGSLRVHLVADRPVVLEKEILGPDPQRLAAEEARDRQLAADEARDEEGEPETPHARPRRVSRQRSHWVVVCQAPCDRDMPLDGRYRITGEGVRNTSPFTLVGNSDAGATITFDAASNGAFVGGLVVSGIGVASVAVGALSLFASLVARSKDASTLGTVGGVCIGGGLALVGGGLVATLTNVHSGTSQSAYEEPRGANDDARRAPGDREETEHRRSPLAAIPTPPTMALLSASF